MEDSRVYLKSAYMIHEPLPSNAVTTLTGERKLNPSRLLIQLPRRPHCLMPVFRDSLWGQRTPISWRHFSSAGFRRNSSNARGCVVWCRA